MSFIICTVFFPSSVFTCGEASAVPRNSRTDAASATEAAERRRRRAGREEIMLTDAAKENGKNSKEIRLKY